MAARRKLNLIGFEPNAPLERLKSKAWEHGRERATYYAVSRIGFGRIVHVQLGFERACLLAPNEEHIPRG
jgi:hypothetical protein